MDRAKDKAEKDPYYYTKISILSFTFVKLSQSVNMSFTQHFVKCVHCT